ncbi:MAG TPA: TetR/AcrR family transcriptional regulator [Gemmatimonadaceae bacterium]|nr:TetR/AcrR family transcriptional regulator [Gemmatimonadaceae bacterium]
MAKGAQTRERIVGHALQLASAEGLEGISIGRLADEVGMSKSGLFAHFRSKEELQLAVLATAVATFTDIVVRPALTEPRGEPRVRALFERWLAWERHESIPGGCVFLQLAAELHERPGPARDALVAAQLRWREALERAARIAVEEGHFRADLDEALFAFQLFGILASYHHTARLLADPDAEPRARRAFAALLAGARRQPAS